MWQFSFYVNKSEIRMGEKFFLQWNDFQATLSQSFRQLRQEKDFFDVTLVSDDEIQIPAHKLVLSACSGFFKSIFKTNAHSHPLLYLSGVTSSNLNFILDYIYQGTGGGSIISGTTGFIFGHSSKAEDCRITEAK